VVRTFLKPFLLVLLALIFATTLTRLDGLVWPGRAGICAQQTGSQPPILVVTEAQVSCTHAAPARITGLYVRGETPRWVATSIGFALPLLLIAAAFVLAVRRLKGGVRVAAGFILAGAGGYVFAMLSAARYAELKLGGWHQLGTWANDPLALRDGLIWLGTGIATTAGLWLLFMAVYDGRNRIVANA
jgi:hypothetical protein